MFGTRQVGRSVRSTIARCCSSTIVSSRSGHSSLRLRALPWASTTSFSALFVMRVEIPLDLDVNQVLDLETRGSLGILQNQYSRLDDSCRYEFGKNVPAASVTINDEPHPASLGL